MSHQPRPDVPPGQTALVLELLDGDPTWRQFWIDHTNQEIGSCLTNQETSSPVVARICHIPSVGEGHTPIKYIWMHEEYTSVLDNLDYYGDIPFFNDYRDTTWDWSLYPDPRIILVDTEDYEMAGAGDQGLKEAVVQKLFEFVTEIRIANNWHVMPNNIRVPDEWTSGRALTAGNYTRIGGLYWIVLFSITGEENTVSPLDETGPLFQFHSLNGAKP